MMQTAGCAIEISRLGDRRSRRERRTPYNGQFQELHYEDQVNCWDTGGVERISRCWDMDCASCSLVSADSTGSRDDRIAACGTRSAIRRRVHGTVRSHAERKRFGSISACAI